MSASLATATAASFVWLGMVLAISFIEAPVKFRAPGVSLKIGLGIGRLVFRALNACELVLAVLVAIALLVGDPGRGAATALAVAVGALLVQLVLVRPALTRRSDAVLAAPEGVTGPGSRAHLWYVGAEVVKVVALLVGGILLLAD
ncbi:hypothetical protein [Nocardioides daeguensis]|uniref:DUF4149 domain-containing protein n=1 Tax=Nocardioides daeguensis TaxID=908359 RepID=A0ABP6WAQ8_9ACTN|nr:hypothetical protein [Nocardioides daeguensis]MBV6729269.1 hypothetical protein [Nocardioides daeguensis]MCR1774245.1 hypothetical protein [Nocardioides daeguensis]